MTQAHPACTEIPLHFSMQHLLGQHHTILLMPAKVTIQIKGLVTYIRMTKVTSISNLDILSIVQLSKVSMFLMVSVGHSDPA